MPELGADFDELTSKYLAMPLGMAERASETIRTQLNVIGPPVEGSPRGEIDEQVMKLHEGTTALIEGILEALVRLGHGDTEAIEQLSGTLQNAEEDNLQTINDVNARH